MNLHVESRGEVGWAADVERVPGGLRRAGGLCSLRACGTGWLAAIGFVLRGDADGAAGAGRSGEDGRTDGGLTGALVREVRAEGLLDDGDSGADPGVVTVQDLDDVRVVLVNPEHGLGPSSAGDTNGFGPELGLELKEAALVSSENEALDVEGPEVRVGDAGRLLQSLMVEASFDAGGQAGEAAPRSAACGAAVGSGSFRHGGGFRLRLSAWFHPGGA
jgi:hypothetical protein